MQTVFVFFVLCSLIQYCASVPAKHTPSVSAAAKTAEDEAQAYFKRSGPWDNKDIDSLLHANKVWASLQRRYNPQFFEDMKKGHAPKMLWIGCSDARVPPNDILGEAPGNVFVHRNIANLVISTDSNFMSVLQYAVDFLKVKHIIVCGHYNCGGVNAALSNTDHRSPLESWLKNIKDTARLFEDELDQIPDLKARQRRLVELNVQEQCLNLLKTSTVQRRRVLTKREIKQGSKDYSFVEPQVHGIIYEPTTGIAHKLPIDFSRHIKEYNQVYNLYDETNIDIGPGGVDDEH